MTEEQFETIVLSYISSTYDGGLQDFIAPASETFIKRYTRDAMFRARNFDPIEVVAHWGAFIFGYTESLLAHTQGSDAWMMASRLRIVLRRQAA